MNLELTSYSDKIDKLFSEHSNSKNASAMTTYMKDKFPYYGIKSRERKFLQSEFLKTNGLPDPDRLPELVQILWEKPHREIHYFTIDLIRKLVKKLDATFLDTLEFLITNKSWWDTVDHLANPIGGPLLNKFSFENPTRTDKWSESKDMWLQRSSIIYQLGYRTETNTELLKKYIEKHMHSKEFFLRKAIGWALRQCSKSNQSWVKEFVKTHQLSGLSNREATKYFYTNKL